MRPYDASSSVRPLLIEGWRVLGRVVYAPAACLMLEEGKESEEAERIRDRRPRSPALAEIERPRCDYCIASPLAKRFWKSTVPRYCCVVPLMIVRGRDFLCVDSYTARIIL